MHEKSETDRPINSTTHRFVLNSTSTGKLQHLPRGTLIPTTFHELPAMKSAASLNTSSSSVYPLLQDWGLWEGGKYPVLFTFPQAASSLLRALTAPLLLTLVGWIAPLFPRLLSLPSFLSFLPSPVIGQLQHFWTSIMAVKLHQWLSCWQTCHPIKFRFDDQGAGSRELNGKTECDKPGREGERKKERKRDRDYSISKLAKSGINSIS